MGAELPPLIPPVKRFDAMGGLYLLPKGALTLTCFGGELPVRGLELLRHARHAPLHVQQRPGSALAITLGAPDAELLPPAPPEGSPEAYAIALLPRGIAASARTPVGLFRACGTLAQLLTAESLPCGTLHDAPDRAIRGLMLDVSRNRTYSLATLFRVVDALVQLKANRLELYFENVFAYRGHPTIWANTSPYTAGDLLALSHYCAERFITLVPNQNTLGHFERWFRADPTYLRYAECPAGGVRTPWGSIQKTPTGLRTADPETTHFLDGLLEELLPCFPHAQTANLGGDEVFDLGLGRSAGAGDKASLYLGHYAHLAATARRFGKAPALWADMLLRHPDMLPRAKDALPDAQWILWGYEATDPLAAQAETLAQAGLDFLVAPGSSSWRSFCGRTDNMLANIRAAAALPTRGLLLTDWGDAGHWQPLAITLPPTVLALSLAWQSHVEPDLPAACDALAHCRGLGNFLLALGKTYLTAGANAPNATKLFQAYNLPRGQGPALDPEALARTLVALDALAEQGEALGQGLLAREARFALQLQRLATQRALGHQNLHRARAKLAAQLQLLWLERGPVAQLEASLADFLAPEL